MKQKFLLKAMLLLCALVVGSSSVWAEDAKVTLDFSSNTDWKFPAGNSNKTVAEQSFTAGGYTIKVAGSTGQGYYWNNSGYLLFGKTGAYVELPAFSFNVSKIKLTYNSGVSTSNKQNIYVSSTAVSTEGTADGSNPVEFAINSSYQEAGNVYKIQVTTNNNCQLTKIEIFEATGGGGGSSTVATPTFDPAGGTYPAAQSVAISCGTADAIIHYTTNGEDPTESDATYSSAVSITTSGTVLKAKAFKEGMEASSVASATYTIKPNAPTISAVGATVTITGTDGCTFYYTTDESTPTNSSTEYSAPFNLGADCTIKAIAYDGNSNKSDVRSYNYKYMPLSPKNANTGYFVKVTDVSTLENGDAILIVNETASKALGPQSGNNCPAKAVTITEGVINGIGDAQKLVLVKKTEKVGGDDTDVFYFYTGTGYLYASSNSSNYLKEQDPVTSNARATIAIASGNATITFKGDYSHNLVRYNKNSSLFSCYASDQEDVQIYKEVVPVTIASSGYSTIAKDCGLDFANATPAGLEAYIVPSITASTVSLSAINEAPASTGVILKGTAGTTYSIPVKADAADVGTNKLQAAVTATAIDANEAYILQGGLFHLVTAASSVPAGKAYLLASDIPTPAPELTFDFGNGNTTGISSLTPALSKVEGIVYDLQGRRVAQPTKGLYIVNGKKVVIK